MGVRARTDPTSNYDVIVIGGGMGGHNTAIRASQLGLRVACIERESKLGGAGLRTGCIPSLVLLHASKMYDAVRKGKNAALGIDGAATLNLARMMAYKATTVEALSKRVQALLRKHGVMLVHGNARVARRGSVVVTKSDGAAQTLSGKNIVIATGSEPVPFPDTAFDHRRIIDSADALSLERVPRHLTIVGAGAVGVEIGLIWRRLGARVTLIERRDRICSWLDREVAAALEISLKRQGVAIRTSTDVVGLDAHRDGVRLRMPDARGKKSLDAELVLVAIGRRPAIAGLNLESVGLPAGAGGPLSRCGPATDMPGIWAVGDVAAGPMLVSKAEEDAIACAELIAGLPGFVDYAAIPQVLHTTPEVATIGRTEEELQAAGIPYKIGCFPLAANVAARIHGADEGFVKLLVDTRTGLIAGAHLIGRGATELISEISVAMGCSTICEDFARTCRPYSAWAGGLQQAAMAAGGWMMHA